MGKFSPVLDIAEEWVASPHTAGLRHANRVNSFCGEGKYAPRFQLRISSGPSWIRCHCTSGRFRGAPGENEARF